MVKGHVTKAKAGGDSLTSCAQQMSVSIDHEDDNFNL